MEDILFFYFYLVPQYHLHALNFAFYSLAGKLDLSDV